MLRALRLSSITRSIIAVLSLIGILNSPCFAGLSAAVLESKIKSANILSDGDKVTLVVKGSDVSLSKFRPLGSDNAETDCKVDAVLISKTLIKADSTIKTVRIRFHERTDPAVFSDVLVKAADIKAFASGKKNQQQLLKALSFTPSTTNSGVTDASGAKLSVHGVWSSDWGPVTLVQNEAGLVTGYWLQSASQKGQIKQGVFNAKARTLTFVYFEPWRKLSGTARFVLSSDNRKLVGEWTQGPLHTTGPWVLQR